MGPQSLADRLAGGASGAPALAGRLRKLTGAVRHRLGARLRSNRGRLRTLGRRLASDWLRQLIGDNPRRVLRLSSLALMVGDHGTARALTAPIDGRTSEHDLAVYLIAGWEIGDRDAARAHAEEQLELGGQARGRAVSRFYLYLEEPASAERALGELDDAGVGVALEIAQAWRRYGDPERSMALIDRVLAISPKNQRAAHLRAAAEGEHEMTRRVRVRKPAPGPSSVDGDGPILHMVSRSLPHHHAGSTYRTHYLVEAQRRAGWDAHVVTECGFAGHGAVRQEEFDGVPYHRLHGEPIDHRLDSWIDHHVDRAARLVEELKPRLLHPASDYRNGLVALELGERYNLPVVYEVRGFPEEYLPRRPGSQLRRDAWNTRRELETECWRGADHIVTLAEVMKRHIAAKGVDPDRITVVPNAVDIDRFQPAPRDEGLANRLGIRPGETVIGYVSSFSAYEGIRYLIEAAAHLTQAGHAVKILLVGDGAETNHLRELTRRLKVSDRVVLTGRVEHGALSAYYDLIDIFVVPRTREATTDLVTPLKPFEAMAMKKPVVVSGTTALSEVIRDGETGLHFEPEDCADLAAQLERLIGDRDLRRQVGEAGRKWVAENRTWRANAALYSRLYEILRAVHTEA